MCGIVGAVANRDIKAGSSISGVGKKPAERIVVELGDKVGASGAWEASNSSTATMTMSSREAMIRIQKPARGSVAAEMTGGSRTGGGADSPGAASAAAMPIGAAAATTGLAGRPSLYCKIRV